MANFAELVFPEGKCGGCSDPECVTLRRMSVHEVGGRGRRFLCRYAPRTTCWRSVGPHRECGFDAGGPPGPRVGLFGRTARAGALRSAGPHAAQRRFESSRRGVGWVYPWIPSRSECEGMRRDHATRCGGVGDVPTHLLCTRTKVCHYAPSSEGAPAGGSSEIGFGHDAWGPFCDGGARGTRVGVNRREEGRDIPMRFVEPSEPWNPTPKRTDTRLNASQDG